MTTVFACAQEHLTSCGKRGSAQEIAEVMKEHKVRFASKDSELSVTLVRTLMRIVKRPARYIIGDTSTHIIPLSLSLSMYIYIYI